MEMEVMEARLIRASELNGEIDDDDTGQTHSYTQGLYRCRGIYQSAEASGIYVVPF